MLPDRLPSLTWGEVPGERKALTQRQQRGCKPALALVTATVHQHCSPISKHSRKPGCTHLWREPGRNRVERLKQLPLHILQLPLAKVAHHSPCPVGGCGAAVILLYKPNFRPQPARQLLLQVNQWQLAWKPLALANSDWHTCCDVPHLHAPLCILCQHMPPVGQHSRVLNGRDARGGCCWLQLLCRGPGAWDKAGRDSEGTTWAGRVGFGADPGPAGPAMHTARAMQSYTLAKQPLLTTGCNALQLKIQKQALTVQIKR